MKHLKAITSAIKEKRLIKIYRYYTDDELTDHGFVLASSNDFLLLQNDSDFLLDGYSIIKISEIEKIRYGKFEKYFEMMLNNEGFTQKVGISYYIDLRDFNSIFNSIKSSKKYVITECQHKNDGRFIIGPIENVTPKSVQIRYFDATGYLKDKITDVKYKDITTIQFDTRYLNHFTKYLRTMD